MAAYHAPKRVALACKRMRSGFSVLKFCMRTFSGYLFRNRQARRRKLHIACGDFFTKVTGALITLRLLFRKRSRLLRLLACKRAHNAFAALPTFCGVREFKSLSIKMKTIFFVSPLHVVANYVSFAATFLLIGVIFSRSFYKFKTSKILF